MIILQVRNSYFPPQRSQRGKEKRGKNMEDICTFVKKRENKAISKAINRKKP